MSGARRTWTEDELTFLRENWQLPDEELKEKLNHSRDSIANKRRQLGLIGKTNARQKDWSEEEITYLREKWGERTIPEIAKALGRTINGVRVKSVRLGLIGQVRCGEMLSARKVSELLGVDVHVVTDRWIPKYNLRAKKKRRGASKQTTTIIMFSDLLAWLESHTELWDSRRIESYGLGVEYEWLKNKRKQDALLPPRKAQKWNTFEDRRAVDLYRNEKTYQEIGEILGRSACAVEHRLNRLDVWGSGQFISDGTRKKRKQDAKEGFERKVLALRLVNTLKAYRNSQQFGEYWQKDMCQHWSDVDGCTAGELNCDECAAFLRIVPQNCVRCGITFYERKPNRICARCRQQRKKQAYKKYLIIQQREH